MHVFDCEGSTARSTLSSHEERVPSKRPMPEYANWRGGRLNEGVNAL